MVLRHKLKQMSFLHVFHHMSILLLADNAYHMAPWPPITNDTQLNCPPFMYTYYGLRAIRPLNEISWKKRITQLQIAQFLFDYYSIANGYLNHGFCVYSMLYGLGLLTLFTNYHYQAFIRRGALEINFNKINIFADNLYSNYVFTLWLNIAL